MPDVSARWGVLGQGIYGAEDYGMSICTAYAVHIQWMSNVRLGPEQSQQDSGTPNQARGGGTGSIERSDSEGERRFVYYGETDAGRVLAVIVTERGERIRVVTAYDLDAGQRRDYLNRRTHGD